MAKILLAEDDVVLAEGLCEWLKFEQHVVDHFTSGREVSNQLKKATYDLIIMDWQLPELTGPEICRAYRAAGGETPILFLTSQAKLSDKVVGFDSGADDYLTKPFHGKELLLRVRALLKRIPNLNPEQLTVANLMLDLARKIALKDGVEVELQPREFQLLEFFMRNPDQAFDVPQLLQRVWPASAGASKEAVKTAVKKLRKKIDPTGVLLQTRHGHGYIMLSKPGQPQSDQESQE